MTACQKELQQTEGGNRLHFYWQLNCLDLGIRYRVSRGTPTVPPRPESAKDCPSPWLLWRWTPGGLWATWSFVWVGRGDFRRWLLSHWLASVLPTKDLAFLSSIAYCLVEQWNIKLKEYFRGRVVILSSRFSNRTRHKKHHESFLTGRFYTPPTLAQRFLVGGSRVELG